MKTRVLFFLIPEKGHINPTIGPAQALIERGAEVTVFADADISPQLQAAGIDRFVGPRGRAPADAHRGASFARQVRDPSWLREWVRSLLLETVELSIPRMRELIAHLRPDVVALDPMLYAAAIASEREGVPWAAISNSLNPALPEDFDSELLRTVRWLAPERQASFERHGMHPVFRGCDILSPHLTVAFTTEALVGAVPDVALVGPSLPRSRRGDETPFAWERLDPALPVVYMSLGSQIHHQPELFRLAIATVRSRPVQLILCAPDLADELGTLPSNVLACAYLPQLELLRRTSVFITHGGANSLMEAIAFGVPPIVLPLCNDQVHQGHFVTRAGIGRTLDADTASVEALGSAIDALLADGPERRRMAEVSRGYQRDGAAETAERLLSLVTSPRASGRPSRAPRDRPRTRCPP